MIKRFIVETTKKKEVVDLTHRINVMLAKEEKDGGICTIFTTHTTACLTTGETGEGTDEDLLEVLEKMIPRIRFRHAHDPSHAWSHIASSIVGHTVTLPFENHKLLLGVWQSIMFVELDGPRERTVLINIS